MTTVSTSRRLLILSCSMTKRAGPKWMPARNRYDGPLWRTLRHVDPGEQKARAAILSAHYGFRDANMDIEQYEARMTPEIAAAMKRAALARDGRARRLSGASCHPANTPASTSPQ